MVPAEEAWNSLSNLVMKILLHSAKWGAMFESSEEIMNNGSRKVMACCVLHGADQTYCIHQTCIAYLYWTSPKSLNEKRSSPVRLTDQAASLAMVWERPRYRGARKLEVVAQLGSRNVQAKLVFIGLSNWNVISKSFPHTGPHLAPIVLTPRRSDALSIGKFCSADFQR